MTKTLQTLAFWGRGDAEGEYLAADILRIEGFTDIDPVHPQGGRDGKKDLTCCKGPVRFVAACYFPNNSTEIKFSGLKKKFAADLVGVAKNGAQGFIFVTNVHVTDGERKELEALGQSAGAAVVIYHLERLRTVLDAPAAYGVRLKHLEVEMTKEEQIAFVADRDQILAELTKRLDRFEEGLSTERLKSVIKEALAEERAEPQGRRDGGANE